MIRTWFVLPFFLLLFPVIDSEKLLTLPRTDGGLLLAAKFCCRHFLIASEKAYDVEITNTVEAFALRDKANLYNEMFYVENDEGDMVAFAEVGMGQSESLPIVQSFVVAPAYRMKGIGSFLMSACAQEVMTWEGCPRILGLYVGELYYIALSLRTLRPSSFQCFRNFLPTPNKRG